ncbi:hypothetical protein FGE12_13600 [Aggregicoccus sp. 17bor-14]|uniref:hypothetical protein n=1 Tax=Myxococcaceae TaxID=31 RepID=UPI00129C6C2A|nr:MULTISPECIES: hypothetical protein [Myxococcaceae]MBF5043427.1 hypothetical protein [Simulacricoccus sp. 17bor-14]MRI89185.1 hypothetical protein [Aggregicoccus sp. 17bor-14]
MSREKNTAYLLKVLTGTHEARTRQRLLRMAALWVALLGLFSAYYFYLARTAPATGGTQPLDAHRVERSERPSTPPRPLMGMAVAGGIFLLVLGNGFVVAKRRRRERYRQLARTLRSSDVFDGLSYVHSEMQRMRRIPDRDAYEAQSRAQLYALFGEEVAARQQLDAVRWEGRAPLVQSCRLNAELWIALLCQHDLAEAERLHSAVQRLSQVPPWWPGAGEMRMALQVQRAAIDVAAGRAESERLPVLEQGLEAHHPFVRLLAAWGLARGPVQTSVDAARRILQEEAPHAKGLHG